MKFYKYILLLIITVIIRPAFAQNSTIMVAAAANVQYAMQELKSEFTKETGIRTEIVIGSSGQLTAQIQQGAPYDIFISADMKYPKTLYKNKMAIEAPKAYAYGALVIWTMKKGINFDINLKELLSNRIEKIALANPRTAPYGVAAVQVLKYYGIYEQVKGKLVYGESISPTNQYIVSQAVDVGFTAKSVVMSPVMNGKGKWMEVSTDAYSSIEQGCVILKYGFENHKKGSKLFYNFLFSGKAKNILHKFGYKTSNGK